MSKAFQTCPNLSKLVQTYPNVSKRVQTCPNLSKLVSILLRCEHKIISWTSILCFYISGTVIKVRENWSETVEVPKDRRGAARGATGPSPVQVRQRKPQRKPQKRIRRMSSTNRGTMAREAQPSTCSSNSSSLTCKLGYGDSGLSLGLKKYMLVILIPVIEF